MAISSLTSSTQPLRHPLVHFYKEAIRTAKLASNITYSSGLNAVSSVVIANVLTIDSPATLAFSTPSVGMIFVDTLVLNGEIRAVTYSGETNGVSKGGDNVGSVAIFARQITGSGVVRAYGGNGQTPTNASTVNGQSQTRYPYFGKANSYTGDQYSGNGNEPTYSTSLSMSGGRPPQIYGYTQSAYVTPSTAPFIYPSFIDSIDGDYAILSGFGASGASTASTSSGYGNAGSGAASIYTSGGNGGSGGTTGGGGTGHYGTGGGGGGGGGFVYIVTESAIPAITVNAYGGNGGSGYNSGGGGGGGAGGVISLIAPSTSAIYSVAGGNGGGITAGYGGTAGQNGYTGLYLYTKMNLSG